MQCLSTESLISEGRVVFGFQIECCQPILNLKYKKKIGRSERWERKIADTAVAHVHSLTTAEPLRVVLSAAWINLFSFLLHIPFLSEIFLSTISVHHGQLYI